MEAEKRNRLRILLIPSLILILYYLTSIIIFKGDFIVGHYYSFDSKEKCKNNGIFISDELDLKIEGDSLKEIPNLNSKFYSNKSTYQKFYGFLISTNNEDKNYRRIAWEEPLELSKNRNWIVTNNGEYMGEAFYVGHSDAKIGDTLTLIVKNPKTDFIIGSIKIKIK
ncbi:MULTISPECIES: hypothetical protein [unclassified Chryseobacterium]|uniref:hypothetical protein n=1 Tax=unclassified Chryseobacterium TaxID=2593645 RepID=UPI0030164B58